MLFIDVEAPSRAQGIQLEVEGLITGRHAGIANQRHRTVLSRPGEVWYPACQLLWWSLRREHLNHAPSAVHELASTPFVAHNHCCTSCCTLSSQESAGEYPRAAKPARRCLLHTS